MLTLLYLILTQAPILGLVYQKAFEKPLSQKEEAKLIELMANGDNQAREKLICHNLRLVAHIAKKYENNLDSQEDLISIGTIGLMKAIDTYTYNKQTKLGTYAARCITNEILMHLRTNKKRALDVSLNEQIAKDKDGTDITIDDTLSSPQENIIDLMEKQDKITHLRGIISILDTREYEIIEMRYGLNNKDALTQKEIAKKLNISRSYVSRIEKRALLKLYRELTKAN